MLQFSISKKPSKTNFHVIFCWQSESTNTLQCISRITSYSDSSFLKLLEKKQFIGKTDQTAIFTCNEKDSSDYLVLIGLGKKTNDSVVDTESYRYGVGLLTKLAESYCAQTISIECSNSITDSIETDLHEFIIASSLGHYHFDTYKLNDHKASLPSYTFILNDTEKYHEIVKEAECIANATNQARTWCDMPPSDLYPATFVSQIQSYLKDCSNLNISVLSKKEIEAKKMGGVLAVCQGSEHDPYVVCVEYKAHNAQKTVGLVGKGVTFDTGGISIKPSDCMDEMKDDMAGAACVMAVMKVISEQKPSVNVISCVPLVENMPDGNAFRPGDIIRFYNGKTAEVKNTDAEGRLILADALAYISDVYKPNILIDFATLTGACRVALGPLFAAVMGRNNNDISDILQAGNKSGDLVWQLPFDARYNKAIKSNVADICNIGGGGYRAGTITAGMFLSHFVPENISWMHIDIAGTSFGVPDRPYFRYAAATGYGVRLLSSYLCS